MDEWQHFWKDILTTTRKERISFLVMIFTVGIGWWVYVQVHHYWIDPPLVFDVIPDSTILVAKEPKPAEKPDSLFSSTRDPLKKSSSKWKKPTPVVVELNKLVLESLPLSEWRIPPFLQKRIIKYRDLLGGFTSLDQLNEVYGFNSEKVSKSMKYWKVSGEVQCLHLHQTEFKSFIRHPYFDKEDVTTIFTLRKKRQDSLNLENIQKKLRWSEEKWKKVLPYLCK